MRLSDGTTITKMTLNQMVEGLENINALLLSMQQIMDDVQLGWKGMEVPQGRGVQAEMCEEALEGAQTDLEDVMTSASAAQDSLLDLIDVWGISTLAFRNLPTPPVSNVEPLQTAPTEEEILAFHGVLLDS